MFPSGWQDVEAGVVPYWCPRSTKAHILTLNLRSSTYFGRRPWRASLAKKMSSPSCMHRQCIKMNTACEGLTCCTHRTLFLLHHLDGRMLTGHERLSTSKLLEDFRFLDGLEPSFSSCSARILPSSRACRRSKAVKAPPPPLGKSSSFAGAGTAIASEDLFIAIEGSYLLQ